MSTIKIVSPLDPPEAEALEESLGRKVAFQRGLDSIETYEDNGTFYVEARFNDGGTFYISGESPEQAAVLAQLMLN